MFFIIERIKPLTRSDGRSRCSLLTLLLAVPSGGADCDLAAGNVDREIHRLGERRTFLDVVVADELEVTPLREDCSFIIGRAILETEEQACGNPIAVDDLE
jgi:hypothetical protein